MEKSHYIKHCVKNFYILSVMYFFHFFLFLCVCVGGSVYVNTGKKDMQKNKAKPYKTFKKVIY